MKPVSVEGTFEVKLWNTYLKFDWVGSNFKLLISVLACDDNDTYSHVMKKCGIVIKYRTIKIVCNKKWDTVISTEYFYI